MPAQLSVSPNQPVVSSAASAAAAAKRNASSQTGYTHVIESGESLYAIARKYDVSTDSLVRANGLASADKIFVGQKIMVPGATGAQTQSAPMQTAAVSAQPRTPVKPAAAVTREEVAQPTPVKTTPAAAEQTPVQTASVAATEAKPAQAAQPAAGNGKFRWPASGKLISDFAASKGTGINIEVPEGTAVRAADAGTVIYVGNAVEGYGNLILIKHENGFVSAYAHLSQASVSKGDAVARGSAIGLAGMTGSVNRPQLHFELRKGATPVDPVPLMAG